MSDNKISVDSIKKLREITGIGMQDAQKALQEAGGDLHKAVDVLRKQGAATAAKKSTRTAKQGIIASYLHGTKVGVLLELNCETDFVAMTPDFINFAHEIALQIAGANPRYVSRDHVPEEDLEKERAIFQEQALAQQKPAAVTEKIVAGKLTKFYEDSCLLDQPSIKDSKVKVSQMLTDAIAKLGENIVIGRFVRYQLGEEKF